MAPQRRAGAALEQAGDRAGLARPPCGIRQHGVEHRGVGRAIDTRLQRRGRCRRTRTRRHRARRESSRPASGPYRARTSRRPSRGTGRGARARHPRAAPATARARRAARCGNETTIRASAPDARRARNHVAPCSAPRSLPDQRSGRRTEMRRLSPPSLTGPVSISRITRLSSRSTTATSPSIGRAQKLLVPARIEAGDPDKAAALLARIADIAGRKGGCRTTRSNRSKAAAAHRLPASRRSFHGYPLRRCPLLGRNGALHARYRRPASRPGGRRDRPPLHRRCGHGAAMTNARRGKDCARLRSQHRRLVRLVEVDRRKARAASAYPGIAQHRHDRLDLVRAQRVERVASGTRGNGAARPSPTWRLPPPLP